MAPVDGNDAETGGGAAAAAAYDEGDNLKYKVQHFLVQLIFIALL